MEWDNITDRYLQYLSEREKKEEQNSIIVIKNNESK